jgi:hypothetical protein
MAANQVPKIFICFDDDSTLALAEEGHEIVMQPKTELVVAKPSLREQWKRTGEKESSGVYGFQLVSREQRPDHVEGPSDCPC